MGINLSCSCSPIEGRLNIQLIDSSVVIECLKCGEMKRFKSSDAKGGLSE